MRIYVFKSETTDRLRALQATLMLNQNFRTNTALDCADHITGHAPP